MALRGTIPLLLLLSLTASVRPDEKQDAKRLKALSKRFRTLDTRNIRFSSSKASKLSVLNQIAAIGSEAAFEYLADLEHKPRHVDLQPDILRTLARVGKKSPAVAEVFRRHSGSTDPYRLMARDFLLERAKAKRDEGWLEDLFSTGPVEDRFLALRALGEINGAATLAGAWELLRDAGWKVGPGTAVHCGTIAHAVKGFEGTDAARLLLLLTRDSRFRHEDRAVLRHTTRLWATGNLHKYIKISDLAHTDATKRVESVRFMGDAGIEAARAPLLALASNRSESETVRGAAARALGGLKIARGALARDLLKLVPGANPVVRRGLLAGLARLRVRPAAVALADMIGGPHDGEVRAALAAEFGQKKERDWKLWLQESRLRSGT